MPANQATVNALEKESEALAVMFLEGKIDADIYAKGVLKLAAEWMSVDEPLKAKDALKRVTPEYIKDVLGKHMEEDVVFRQLVVYLCETMVNDGWVYMGREYNFSRPPEKV